MERPNDSDGTLQSELDELIVETAIDILLERALGGDEYSRQALEDSYTKLQELARSLGLGDVNA